MLMPDSESINLYKVLFEITFLSVFNNWFSMILLDIFKILQCGHTVARDLCHREIV